MVTFRNNNNNNQRRNNFRRNDRNYKSNGDRQKFSPNFTNNDNFKRKAPGRNNHNAAKLIEKYNDLAREASSNGDKILSENYLQHADHFTRVLNEREIFRREKFDSNSIANKDNSSEKNQEDSQNVLNSDLEDKTINKKETGDQETAKDQVEIS
tara:strand:- start:503 stop:964 length:462 start_codon:yes stop_codon:yes gene_type:complete